MIKIEFPSTVLASFKIPVRITDINYGNHVGNDAFISIVHEARMQWLATNNFTELNIHGTGLIMAGLCIQFKAEGMYGDIIEVEIATGEIAQVRFELYYNLITHREGQRKILAIAHTMMVSYDYDRRKTIPLQPALIQMLQKTSS